MMYVKAKILRSLAEKSKGLIGADPIYPVFFTTRWGIHTFGMKSAIDVVILNKDNQVVTLMKHLKPNNIFFWNPAYDRVLELPPGTVEDKRIRLGNQIMITK